MWQYAILLSVVLLSDPAAGQEEGECAPAQRDSIVMPGVLREDVTLDYQGAYLQLRVGGEDELRFDGFHPLNAYADLGQFRFDDAVMCTREVIDGGFDLAGINDGEIVLGTNAPDRIRGARGNDTLQGRNGDDVYLYGRGDGVDCIADVEGTTTISFDAGIAPADVGVADDGNGGRYVRLLYQDGTVSAQGMNIREGAALSFAFGNGRTLSASDLAPIEGDVNHRALRAPAHACHWEAIDAVRAGLVNHRAESPQPPARPAVTRREPTPSPVPSSSPGKVLVMTSDGRLQEVEMRRAP